MSQKIAYGHHVLRDGNPHHLDAARFAVCEIRMSSGERSLRRSYSVSSKETATGEQSPVNRLPG
ncbi:Uncharacterised protein [Escherichia coli]|nr:Uncharacterised protein [Escherichia coli]